MPADADPLAGLVLSDVDDFGTVGAPRTSCNCTIRRYHPCVEGGFSLIERWHAGGGPDPRFVVRAPGVVDPLAASIAELRGDGTACLVWVSSLAAGRARPAFHVRPDKTRPGGVLGMHVDHDLQRAIVDTYDDVTLGGRARALGGSEETAGGGSVIRTVLAISIALSCAFGCVSPRYRYFLEGSVVTDRWGMRSLVTPQGFVVLEARRKAQPSVNSIVVRCRNVRSTELLEGPFAVICDDPTVLGRLGILPRLLYDDLRFDVVSARGAAQLQIWDARSGRPADVEILVLRSDVGESRRRPFRWEMPVQRAAVAYTTLCVGEGCRTRWLSFDLPMRIGYYEAWIIAVEGKGYPPVVLERVCWDATEEEAVTDVYLCDDRWR
jgi:hypothetical protein